MARGKGEYPERLGQPECQVNYRIPVDRSPGGREQRMLREPAAASLPRVWIGVAILILFMLGTTPGWWILARGELVVQSECAMRMLITTIVVSRIVGCPPATEPCLLNGRHVL